MITLAAVFSGYQLVLAGVAVTNPVGPTSAAMVLYAILTLLVLWPSRKPRMPLWLATVCVVGSVVISTLAREDLPSGGGGIVAVWYVPAVGILLAVTSARRRQSFAWAGICALIAQTGFFEGLGALVALGVFGPVAWVATSHCLTRWLAGATRDAALFAQAEREALQWRAAQEAHIGERLIRLGSTSRMSLSMLRGIVESGGQLDRDQRTECRHLEAAIRDEIRGRALLNDRVRFEVMAARRRGLRVMLLDDGGIDSLPPRESERVLNALAAAIGSTASAGALVDGTGGCTEGGRIVARTVNDARPVAVTVLALSCTQAFGEVCVFNDELPPGEEREEVVDLWLEIPRVALALTPQR